MSDFDNMPGRGANRQIEAKAEAAFQSLLAKSRDFHLQRADVSDFGTDCQIEVLDQGHPTNVRLHVQLKGTERPLNKDGSLSIQIERTNLNYLLTQPHSLFVAYHVPTDHLRVATVEGVLRHYDHSLRSWRDQQTLTVTFNDPLTLERLAELSGLARTAARGARDRRIVQVTTDVAELPAVLRETAPSLHVPAVPEQAARMAEQLYASGMDAALSGAFDQFEAILGANASAMGWCFMAEINLGMDGKNRFPERIRAAIEHFEREIDGGRIQPGSVYYTLGNAYSALGGEAAAKLCYQQAAADRRLMADPNFAAQCLKNLGTSIERLGDEETAAELYRGALQMNPDQPEAHFALGQYLSRKGRFDEALVEYDAVIFAGRGRHHSIAVDGWRLNALFNLGDIREAYRTINQLLAEAQSESWIWNWCARQVAAFGRTSVSGAKGALAFWPRYIREHPDATRARVELLLVQIYLRGQGEDCNRDYPTFRREFERQVETIDAGDAALLWDRLGHYAQDQGDWDEAERCFRKAYEIARGHFGCCLATALNALGRYAEALPLALEQASEEQPGAQSWFQLAFAQAHLGQVEEALASYARALLLDPDYELAMYGMAGLLWNEGEFARAEQLFREAAQRFPDHPETAKLRDTFPTWFADQNPPSASGG